MRVGDPQGSVKWWKSRPTLFISVIRFRGPTTMVNSDLMRSIGRKFKKQKLYGSKNIICEFELLFTK